MEPLRNQVDCLLPDVEEPDTIDREAVERAELHAELDEWQRERRRQRRERQQELSGVSGEEAAVAEAVAEAVAVERPFVGFGENVSRGIKRRP